MPEYWYSYYLLFDLLNVFELCSYSKRHGFWKLCKLPPFVFGTPPRIHATETTGGPAKVAKITGRSFINERDHD